MPCPEKFVESLERFRIDEDVQREILAGYDGIVSKTPKKTKAAFFQRAMTLLDARAEPDTVRELMLWNACCKTGARLKASQEFARINAGLPRAEKLEKLRRAPYRNMGVPALEAPDVLRIDAVAYVYEGKYSCACSNFRWVPLEGPVSRTYCLCCGGHFQFHYELMLGVKLEQAEVVASPLDTGGAEPCVFRFRIVQK